MPCSGPRDLALHHRRLGRTRRRHRHIFGDAKEAVERGVEPDDAIEAGARQLDRRQLARGDERGRLGDGGKCSAHGAPLRATAKIVAGSAASGSIGDAQPLDEHLERAPGAVELGLLRLAQGEAGAPREEVELGPGRSLARPCQASSSTTLPSGSRPWARYCAIFSHQRRVGYRIEHGVARAGVEVAAPQEIGHDEEIIRLPIEAHAADLGRLRCRRARSRTCWRSRA